jgi:hypothetical protein
MAFFKKKPRKEEPSRGGRTPEDIEPKNLQEKSKYGQKSRIDENILRNGPDKGFVWYEEG